MYLVLPKGKETLKAPNVELVDASAERSEAVLASALDEVRGGREAEQAAEQGSPTAAPN